MRATRLRQLMTSLAAILDFPFWWILVKMISNNPGFWCIDTWDLLARDQRDQALWQRHCCNGTAAIALLQWHWCNCTVAMVLLQLYCCNGTAAMALLHWHCCNGTAAMALLHWHCCNGIIVMLLLQWHRTGPFFLPFKRWRSSTRSYHPCCTVNGIKLFYLQP